MLLYDDHFFIVMKHLISIVLPVYNAERYLNECLYSILNQTYPNFELIVVNDGSTDNSVDVINRYKDKRIKIIENEHDFIKSLNLGIKHANGEYIARMDADDIMLSHRLETQFNYMESNPEVAICGSWAESFGARNYIMKTHVNHHDIVSGLLLRNLLFHPTIMMKCNCIKKHSGYPDLYKQKYPCAEDYKLWTDLAVEKCQFANIPEVLLKYRLSENQATSVRKKEMLQASLQIRIEYAERIMEELSDKDDKLKSFFKDLNNLVNDGKVGLDRLPDIIYPIYLDYK